MKDQVKSQIEKLQSNGNVAQAKSWWAGLSPMQKSVAIGVLTAGVVGTGVYLGTVGAVGGVVTNGVAAAGSIITPYQAFWNAVLLGGVCGYGAGRIAYNSYSKEAVVATNDLEDLKA